MKKAQHMTDLPSIPVDGLGRMSRRDAARTLGMSERTLANYAVKGQGPRHFLVAGKAYYWATDVIAFGKGEATLQAA